MRPIIRFTAACVLTAWPFVAACSAHDSASQEGEFNESDPELARLALQALGADIDGAHERRCQSCHSVSRAKLREWLELSKAANESCVPFTTRRYLYEPRGGDASAAIAELNPTCETPEQLAEGHCYLDPASDLMTPDDALAAVDCMRTDAHDARSPFDPAKLGIETMRAHARNSHFQRLFAKAFADGADAQRSEFLRRVMMPRGALFEDNVAGDADPNYTVAIRKEDFWTIRAWFDRGLPALDHVLEEEPPPETCKPRVTPELQALLADNARKGWTMKNAVDGVTMYGCPGETLGGWPDTALGCLAGAQLATEWQAPYPWPAEKSQIRILAQLTFRTSFWMRSSADGRFVANGGSSGGGGSTITDLIRAVNIPVQASYDPGFFADNSTFVFQGTPVGAGFCPQDMLLHRGEDEVVTFEESGCGGTRAIRLYQHLGTALDGSVSFAANGDYTSDNGGQGQSSTENPSATAGPKAEVTLTPIVRNGTGYAFLQSVQRSTPYEGDTAISPTSRVISARLAGAGGKQLGITVRALTLHASGGSYTVALGEPSVYCDIAGGKTAHSYDDRFMALHGYAAVEGAGKSDVTVIDLYDGKRYQVTDMPAGTFALYPHFRSDGWLYFLVRDTTANSEYAAASDIALHIEKAAPINDVVW